MTVLYQSGHLSITQTLDNGALLRHLWFTAVNGRASLQGSHNPQNVAQPVLSYVAHMLRGVPNPPQPMATPFHAWVLGLGCGSIAHGIMAVLGQASRVQLQAVELEAQVIATAQQYFDCPPTQTTQGDDTAQWHYHCCDIRAWLASAAYAVSTPNALPPPLFVALDAYCADQHGPVIGVNGEYATLAQLLHPKGCLAVNLHQQHGFAAHLKALDQAFSGRVKVHFDAGQGNPIAYAFGAQADSAVRPLRT